jgi:hypothetical protein
MQCKKEDMKKSIKEETKVRHFPGDCL